jgi:hypothetical protein
MAELKNSDILKSSLQSLCTIAGRRTSESFASRVMGAITKTLEQRYGFLKYVRIEDMSSPDYISVATAVDDIDTSEVCKAIEAILRVVYMDLRDNAGLFFIKEFKNYTGEEIVSIIKRCGVDLDLMQLEQQHLYNQYQKKKSVEGNVSLLGYIWNDVSNWKYDDHNKICVLYNKDGNVLDKLNLDAIIKKHIERLTTTEGTTNSKEEEKININEKELELLKMLHSRDLDVEMATVLLHVSREELDRMISRLLKFTLLQYSDFDVVKLSENGINYLSRHM